MKVFLLKDVEQVGMAGQIITVADGYAANFLIPRKLAMPVTHENQKGMAKVLQSLEKQKEVVATKTSMMAERIKSLKVTLKKKMHDDGKLYGSINPAELVELLAEHGVSISKSQILIAKSIKERGTYEVTVKLTSRLLPTFKLQVVSE